MTEPTHPVDPTQHDGPGGPTEAADSTEPSETPAAATDATETDDDRAYVAAALARLDGDLTLTLARLDVVEERVEDIASGLDAIEAAGLAAGSLLLDPGRDDDPTDRELDLQLETPAGPAPTAGTAPAEGIDIGELVEWVREHVALLVERRLPQTGTPPFWCRSWWMHAEAIARFEAVRRCWVASVQSEDGSAMVVFFEHLDHHLAVLMSEHGPFAGCARGEHRAGQVLPLGHDDPDPSYFGDPEQHDGPAA